MYVVFLAFLLAWHIGNELWLIIYDVDQVEPLPVHVYVIALASFLVSVGCRPLPSPPLPSTPVLHLLHSKATQGVTKPCFCCSPCTCIWLISPTSLQPAKFSLMSSFQNIHMILRWFDLTVVGKGGERRCSIGIAVVRFRNDTCMIWLRDDEHFSIEGFWIKVFDSFIEERLFIVS